MVEYINYKEDKYPIRISYFAIKKVKEETGKALEDIENDITILEPLLYYSMEAGHKAESKNFTVKREDVEFMLDECWLDFISLIKKFFPNGDGNIEKKRK
jgi:hypothetical protein